jgi:hypothetical protein
LTSLIFKGLSIKSSKINCFAKAVLSIICELKLIESVKQIKLSADWDDFLIPLSKWALNYSFPAHAEKDKKDSNAYTLDVSFPY